MLDLPKGLLTRFIAIMAGTVLVSALVSVANLSSDGGGIVELLYLLAAAVYLTYFLLKHEDEIPTRSDRD